MKVVERAVAHGTATIPSDGRVGIDLPVVPLGRCFEIEEIGNGGRILHGAEVMGCAAPLGGVARTADAAHINVVRGGRLQACDDKGIASGRDTGARAYGKAVVHIFYLPSNGAATAVPRQCDAVGKHIGGDEVVGTHEMSVVEQRPTITS